MTIKVSKPAKGLREAIAEVIGRGASVINGMTKGDAQDELEVSRKNWIINGDMQVSQRGDYTSATAVTDGNYYLDRWESEHNVTSAKITHQTMTTSEGVTVDSIYLLTETAGAGTRNRHDQHIEDYDSLAGRTLTLSGEIRTNSENCGIQVFDGSSWVALYHENTSGTAKRVSTTFVFPSTATQMIVSFVAGDDQTDVTDGDYIEFTNVKLEIGDTATPFESRSYAEELRDCRRYWWQPDSSGNAFSQYGKGIATNTTQVIICIDGMNFGEIPDEIDHGTIGNLAVSDGVTSTALTALAIRSSSTRETLSLTAAVASGLTQYRTYQLVNNNTTSGKLGVGNEL